MWCISELNQRERESLIKQKNTNLTMLETVENPRVDGSRQSSCPTICNTTRAHNVKVSRGSAFINLVMAQLRGHSK